MEIYQGGNAPIILEFDEDVRSVGDISVGLYDEAGREEKHWGKSELAFEDEGRVAVARMTQEESAGFVEGKHNLLVKIMAEDGQVILYKGVAVTVKRRSDREVILSEA